MTVYGSSAPSPLLHQTNTTHERKSLANVINLSDAHCRQTSTTIQRAIVSRLPEFFTEAQKRSQLNLEDEFISIFMQLAGEPVPADTRRYMLSYSSSCAITMLASYCSRSGKRVALIEPVFDNIPSILSREGVELVPVREEDFADHGIENTINIANSDVVWLVSPNNPTGWSLSESDFRSLIECCVVRGLTVVIDASFRFFDPILTTWSHYDILESYGVSYVMLEDSGKTWSANEMKVGMTVCSRDMYPEMFRLHDDLLQSVSPLHLRFLIELIKDSIARGPEVSILSAIRENRNILRRALGGLPLQFVTGVNAPVSVDWLRILDSFDCTELQFEAARDGVHILPGTNFYWSDALRGSKLVRIALARDPAVVAAGAAILAETTRRLSDRRDGSQSADGDTAGCRVAG